jgi:hypothetical protein
LTLKTGVESDFFNPSYFPVPVFSLQKFNQLNAEVVDYLAIRRWRVSEPEAATLPRSPFSLDALDLICA